MWNLLKLELRSSRFKWANIATIILIVLKIALAYIFKTVEHSYINGIYTTALLFLLFYLLDIRYDKTDVIMNSIPIDKKNLVLSKYSILLIAFMISLIYTILYFWILKLLGFGNRDYLTLKDIIISFSIFVIYTSINLPIFYKMPIALFGFGILANRDFIKPNIAFIGENTIIFLLISIAVLIISILISVHNYKKREFARR